VVTTPDGRLDLVKAFDRVPRELLWAVMRKLGVPEKLVSLWLCTRLLR
jgi:hypothetical protein